MLEIPLFPLNSVLFPGMPLNLHIFEERYKQMMTYCIESKEPFGVVLIRSGQEALGPVAEPYMVGCTAHIHQVQPLTRGRMHIVAIGQDRFKIDSLHHDKPYLMGKVNLFPLEMQDDPRLTRLSMRLLPLVENYLEMLAEAGDVQIDSNQLPKDPMSLAYLAAVLIQIPGSQKQDLLEISSAPILLSRLYTMFQLESELLKVMLRKKDEIDGPANFTLN